jgi:oligopeptide transport system substrate-binding protein
MLRRAEADPDPAARAVLLRAAERHVLKDAVIASVFANPSRNLVDPRVTGWKDNVNDVHPMRWACFAGHATSSNSAAR